MACLNIVVSENFLDKRMFLQTFSVIDNDSH